jgi:hypothetical protein
MNWTTTSKANADNGIKILVYGGSGLGKTSLLATLPKPCILSAESGLLSLRKENIERMFGVGTAGITYDVPVIQIKTIEDLMEAYRFATESAHAAQFDAFGLDSISEIAEVVLSNAKAKAKDPRQAYGALIEQMTTTIRAFRDLPKKHVYFAAKMELMKDDNTGITHYGPSFPGSKLGQGVSYFFDEVFHLGMAKDNANASYRFLRTQPDIQFVAKDRSGALAPMEYPHLGNIINKILNKS